VAAHELWLQQLQALCLGQASTKEFLVHESSMDARDSARDGVRSLQEDTIGASSDTTRSESSVIPNRWLSSEKLSERIEQQQCEIRELQMCQLEEQRMAERAVEESARVMELRAELRERELRTELQERDAEIASLQEQQLRMADAMAEDAEMASARIRREEEQRRSKEVATLILQVKAAELRALELERQLDDAQDAFLPAEEEQAVLLSSVRLGTSPASQPLGSVAEDAIGEEEADAEASARESAQAASENQVFFQFVSAEDDSTQPCRMPDWGNSPKLGPPAELAVLDLVDKDFQLLHTELGNYPQCHPIGKNV